LNIVILTGAELRHDFVRKSLGIVDDIHVQLAYCEDTCLERSILDQCDENKERLAHLERRSQSEKDFFSAMHRFCPDRTSPILIEKGEINKPVHIDKVISLNPDLIVAYGCSIIEDPLLDAFDGRILNVHLGLSPYYRGSGTNFWPLVHKKPEFVGATFMYMDRGIDTGEVIHQVRARICAGDSPHQIGNRLIFDMALVYGEIIRRYESLIKMRQLVTPADVHYYRRKDFTEESVVSLRNNFSAGMIEKYIDERSERCEAVPILVNSVIAPVEKLLEEAL